MSFENSVSENNHLIFKEIASTRHKTKTYTVISMNDGTDLGMVKWHAHWRQYVFHPNDGCIWSHDCLSDLASFIKNLMIARKVKK